MAAMGILINMSHQGKVGQTIISAPVMKIFTNARGKRNFQANSISWSTLSRGSVLRIHTRVPNTRTALIMNHSTAGKPGPFHPLRKRVVRMQQTAKAWVYSANMKRPYFIPEYSVWKPATISESASRRSKGLRLISAKAAMKKIMNARGCNKMKGIDCASTILTMESEPVTISTPTMESTRGIS